MDIEADQMKQQQPQQLDNQTKQMSKAMKRTLIVVNCVLMIVGNSGGPLLSRLYFLRGGHRQWLSSWLQTGGWPLVLIPLSISYLHRRRRDPSAAKLVFITRRLFAACVVLGLLTGLDSFIYTYGLSYLPVSTSSILISAQLAFTALFAFIVVRLRFTPFSLNAVALLTVAAAILALHTGADRPAGVSTAEYHKGFFLTLGAAALYGLVLPLMELAYRRARQVITYTLVMEMQLVMGFFAAAFCTVGMIINNDFKAFPKEARNFELGEVRYYLVLVWSAIFWQCFFLGTAGVIFCANTLLAGIINAVFIPVIEVLGVIFFKEKFSGEKGVALALSVMGLVSYSYGEYKEGKDNQAALLAS